MTVTQADALRRVAAPPALLVAVTGGKGGVGKSTVAANLAVAAATAPGRGLARQVVLVDLDLGLASLDAILGFARRRHLGEVIEKTSDVRSVVVRGPGGVEILPAPRGVRRFAALDADERRRVIEAIRDASRGRDLAVLDLPAGIHPDGLAFTDEVDLAIVVATPEAASLADAYAVTKLALEARPDRRLGFVLNEAAGPIEARRLIERFIAVVRRFLRGDIAPLGWIPRDAAVTRATAARRPVVVAEPSSAAAGAFRLLASRVLASGAI
ncbi:MAG TPA: P-loop NTPase [Planctomycetota bacterium]|nr:P-loop NTPase [Planctomycetota bacterium]